MCGSDDIRLFCNGYYAEVLIMDPFSLEVLFTLSSRMSPDWISALHVLRPAKRKGIESNPIFSVLRILNSLVI